MNLLWSFNFKKDGSGTGGQDFYSYFKLKSFFSFHCFLHKLNKLTIYICIYIFLIFYLSLELSLHRTPLLVTLRLDLRQKHR